MSAPGAGSPGLPNTVVERAPAKVNLFLRVLGRRPDGYHDLDTLVVPIDLFDRLEVHAAAGPEFRTLSFSLTVEGDPDAVRGVPLDQTNLALRAGAALAARAGVRGFADIHLDKRIPSAAGLGGGSADAAAALRALNRLWRCSLPAEGLAEVAAEVGSDVPALLAGCPVRARGRGERVQPAPPVTGFHWVVVTFGFGVSAADAYSWWDQDGGPTGPDPEAVVEAAHPRRGGDLEALGRLAFNDLEGPVMRRHQEVREARDRLLAAGAPVALMCGSGPSVAAILPRDRVRLDRGAEADLERISGRAPRYAASWAG